PPPRPPAGAGEPHRLDSELELAARLVQRRNRPHFDREPIFELAVGELGAMPEEHAAPLGRRILQVEVAMTGCSAREVRDFTRHPDEPELSLEQVTRRAYEDRDGEDRLRVHDKFRSRNRQAVVTNHGPSVAIRAAAALARQS